MTEARGINRQTFFILSIAAMAVAPALAQKTTGSPETFDPGHGQLFGPVRSVSLLAPGASIEQRNPQITMTYDFRQDGRLREIQVFEIASGVSSRETYSYTRDGRLVEVYYRDEGPDVMRQVDIHTYYLYDSLERIARKVMTNTEGDTTMKVVYKNDSLGRRVAMTQMEVRDGKEHVTIESSTYFGRRGGNNESIVYRSGGEVTRRMSVRKVPEGRLKGIDTYFIQGGDTVSIESVTFDDRGWETERRMIYRREPARKEITTYAYPAIDTKGNWLKKSTKTVIDRGPGNTTETSVREEGRVIAYY